jgi:hypothetical protein
VTPAPSPTPRPTAPAVTASVFQTFQRAHASLLGAPVTPLRTAHGYSMQVFAYGALAYSQSSRSVLLLPIGDRILGVRGLLAPHAGNAYPDGFAPVSVLHALGWLPSAPQPVRPATAPHRGPDRMPAG